MILIFKRAVQKDLPFQKHTILHWMELFQVTYYYIHRYMSLLMKFIERICMIHLPCTSLERIIIAANYLSSNVQHVTC